MVLQLPLGIRLPSLAAFDSFLLGDNALTVAMLRELAKHQGEQQVLLWGESGTGKTHLLQAVCNEAGKHLSVAYLPLRQLLLQGSETLLGMEQLDIVCIDECDSVLGISDWEHGLFKLINFCRERQTYLVMACQKNPLHLDIGLPDLHSRLQWGPVMRLNALSDSLKRELLQKRAEQKGLQLQDNVADYILLHYSRDMRFLCESLDTLDDASLAAGRRLTIPFIKTVLG